jgi:hypothetical protein
MIPSIKALEQPIIEQLMECDPVVQEYRAFFRLTGLEPGAGTG